MTSPHENLLAGSIPPTLLPADPATERLADAPHEEVLEITAAHPASSAGWAVLAAQALAVGTREADLAAYAYARTGYHRGLDALRRAGWRGQGPVPWEHEPNQGFLRALWALSRAAARIGDDVEESRCTELLRESSGSAYSALASADEAGERG